MLLFLGSVGKVLLVMNSEAHVSFQVQLAVDDSEYSVVATELVNNLALTRLSRITILGVVPSGQSIYESKLRSVLRHSERILGRKAVDIRTQLLFGHAAKEIIKYGSNYRPDLTVLGTKWPYSKMKSFLGTVAYQVVEHARWPVLITRAPYNDPQRVLLATDGSENSRLTARYLGQFPLPPHTEIEVVYVQPPLVESRITDYRMGPTAFLAPSMPSLLNRTTTSPQAKLQKKEGQAVLSETRRILEAAGRKATGIILYGDPASQILAYSQAQKIDLIVTGPRGLNAAEGWWWGSVTRKLVRHAHCSVLFVRTEAEDKN